MRGEGRIPHVLLQKEARKVPPVELALRPTLFGTRHPLVHSDRVHREMVEAHRRRDGRRRLVGQVAVREATARGIPHILVMALVMETDCRSDAHVQVQDALTHPDVACPSRVVRMAARHRGSEAPEQRARERIPCPTRGISELYLFPLHVDPGCPVEPQVDLLVRAILGEAAQQVGHEDVPGSSGEHSPSASRHRNQSNSAAVEAGHARVVVVEEDPLLRRVAPVQVHERGKILPRTAAHELLVLRR